MKRILHIIIIIFLLFPIVAFGQNELISGWRLKSLGSTKSSQTDVNYVAAAALILQNPSTVLLQIVDEEGSNLGPIIELKSFAIDEDYISPNAFAISGEAILHTGNNLRGNYTFFIQMNEKNRDILRFTFPGNNNNLYMEGRLTDEDFIGNLVRLSIVGTVLQSGGRLKVPLSDIIFGR